MIKIRPSAERGYFDYGWLQTRHTFSFSNYYDPNYMGFRNLRVINQDIVAPGQGFEMHQHRDMEIITYVLRGAVTHHDSMGNKGVIHVGEIQCMSAGVGVRHSEFNDSKTEPLELLQIWILPDLKGLTPNYQQMQFKKAELQFRLLVSSDGRQNSLIIHQDVKLFTATFPAGHNFEYRLAPNRYAWVQMIDGEITIDNKLLVSGDGAAISNQELVKFNAKQKAEFLFFDLN